MPDSEESNFSTPVMAQKIVFNSAELDGGDVLRKDEWIASLSSGYAISTIAFEAGFGDLSYFNHAFRRRYGATPSDIRASRAQDSGLT